MPIKIFLLYLACFFTQQEPTISWTEDHKVTWDDFRSQPKPRADVIAVTASGLSFGYSTTRYSGGRIEYDFEVTAHFYPERSWYIKEDVTSMTLDHERLHFDITELHARKFRQRVNNKRFTRNIDREMEVINNEIHDELRAMQRQYDSETSHSRIPKKQIEWQLYVEEELRKLDRYKK